MNLVIKNNKDKEKKKDLIFSCVLLFVLWILSGWNTWNADYTNYEWVYSIIMSYKSFDAFEPGFVMICKIAQFFDLNYQSFLIFFFGIFLIILLFAIRQYTDYAFPVLCLYTIYPFFWDVVQYRNFVAEIIIILSFKYYCGKGSKKDRYIFIVLVLLASCVQRVEMFYLIFLIPKYWKIKPKHIFISVLILLIISQSSFFLGIIAGIVPTDKIGYFKGRTSSRFFFVTILYMLLNQCVLIYYNRKNNVILNEFADYIYPNDKRNKLLMSGQQLININWMCFTIIPLLALSIDFLRIYRNIFVLNYIYILCVNHRLNKIKDAIMFYGYLTLIFLSLILYLWLPGSETVVKAVIFNNYFWMSNS